MARQTTAMGTVPNSTFITVVALSQSIPDTGLGDTYDVAGPALVDPLSRRPDIEY